jgi:dTMP kinase
LPADEGLERTLGRAEISVKDDQESRYEKMDLEFHERLRRGFLEIARSDPSRCKVIDASRSLNTVFEDIENEIKARYLDEKDEV